MARPQRLRRLPSPILPTWSQLNASSPLFDVKLGAMRKMKASSKAEGIPFEDIFYDTLDGCIAIKNKYDERRMSDPEAQKAMATDCTKYIYSYYACCDRDLPRGIGRCEMGNVVDDMAAEILRDMVDIIVGY
ncbi:MAG: hypothetical protein M1827_005608 [Pycnora praestabilis]|nr:MAG: hypothetical protein M1827_005608 [Pycnora praestabilis]